MGMGIEPSIPSRTQMWKDGSYVAFFMLAAVTAGMMNGQSFTSSGPTTMPTTATLTTINIPVSGTSGSLTAVTLTFNSLNTTNVNGLGFLLEAPDGTHFLDILNGICAQGIGNSTFTLSDTGANGHIANNGCTSTLSGNWQPASYFPGSSYPSPGPGIVNAAHSAGCLAAQCPPSPGTGTFGSIFNGLSGASVNGTWKVYVEFFGGGTPSGSVGSVTLNLTESAGAATVTSLSPGSPNPAFASGIGSSVAVSATVTSNGSPVTNGTVTFHDATNGAVLGISVAVNGSGVAATTVTFTGEGAHSYFAVYNGGSGFAASPNSNSVTETIFNHATVTGTTFCDPGTMTIPNGDPTTGVGSVPYPSSIIMGSTIIAGNPEPNLTGIIQKVTVTLNSLNYGDPDGLGFILQGPNGKSYEFMAGTGGTNSANVTVVFDDAAASVLTSTSPITSGTFRPTSDICNPSCNPVKDPYPTPAPTTFDSAPPFGTSTFLEEFGGAGTTGTWQLFLANRASTGTPGSLGTGTKSWCLNFTMQTNAHSTTTTVSASPNPATQGSTVTLTATVSSDTAVNAGSVSFTDGTTSLGTTTVVNGVATITNTTLPEGTHNILASYGGTSTGTIFGVSSGSTNLRIDHAITESGTYTFCNAGPLTIPGGTASLGAAAPYPSNIAVTGLPGTLSGLTVTLNQFSSHVPTSVTSLLVGPNGGNLDFFSRVGGVNSVGPLNLTFDDNAASQVSNLPANGTASFKPTSAGGANITYPACPPNAPTCQSPPVGPPAPAGPYTYAAPNGSARLGSATAAGVFGGGVASTFNGGGEWSLFQQLLSEDAADGGVAGGWCLNFTQNLPDITVTAGHTPATFVRGGSGTINLTVHNAGPGPTGGTITVTDTLPTGLSATSTGNNGWSCTGTITVTCTSSAAIVANATSSFSFTTSIATTTASSIVNNVAVAGGGDGVTNNNTATDTIPVSGTDLTITKTHSGNFQQGDASDSYTITVQNLGPGATVAGETITVTDNLPAGLTVTGLSGTGWNCAPITGLTCTSTTTIASGINANPITLTVSVASTATSVTNQAAVSAPDDFNTANNTANDPTTILQTTTIAAANATASFSANSQVVVLSASVVATPGLVNSGTVTFTVMNGPTTIGSPVTSGTVTAGAASANYTLPAATPTGVYTIKAVYNPGAGFVTSTDSSHTLTVTSSPMITLNPVSVAVVSGATATFTAAASGLPTPTVQWQVSTDGGATFNPIPGATSTTLLVTAVAALNGNQYRAVFTNSGGSATTTAATLTVTPTTSGPVITTNPTNQSVNAGAIVTFVAAASGVPTPTVQWQVSTDNGVTFNDIPGATSGTLAFRTLLTQNGNLYRAVFTNSTSSATTSAASLTLTVVPGAGLTGAIIAKTGASNARVWTLNLANTGTGTAVGAQVDSLILTQAGGAACSPLSATPFPLALGDIIAGTNLSATVTLDFTGCAAAARFTATINFSANGGALKGSKVIGSQFQ